MKNLRSSGQTGRVTYQLGEVIKSGIKGGQLSAGDACLQALQCIPLQDIPATFETTSLFRLPMTPDQFDNFWGRDSVNPLNILQADSAIGVSEASTDFGPTSQLAADFCLMGIGVTIEGDNENFVVPGAMVPNTLLASVAPDDFIGADVADGGHFAGVTPALLDWGTYSRRMAEDLADALSLQFTIAERLVVIDEALSSIASCGTNQGGMGFSRSDIDTPYYVKLVNDAYAALGTANPFAGSSFRAQNARSDGLNTDGTSTFRPDRLSGQIANMSLNVGRKSAIYTNDCARIFDRPIMIKAGRPFSLTLSTRSRTYLNRAAADATWNFNGNMTEAGFPGQGATFNEWNPRSTPAAAVPVTTPDNVIVLKGGLVKVKVCFYGILLYEQALCDAFNDVCSKYGDACMLQP